MALKTKGSLADKINSLITTAPINFDSDDEVEDTKAKVVDYYDESDDSKDDFQISQIRRQNIDLLDQVDKRYKGKKVSRKDIYLDEDNSDENVEDKKMDGVEEESKEDTNDIYDDANNDNDDVDYDHDDDNIDSGDNIDNDNDNIDSEEYMEDNDNECENKKGSNESDNSNESSLDSDIEDKHKSDVKGKVTSDDIISTQRKTFPTMLHTNMRGDIEKGNCVRSQLQVWENLLEIRIKLQKCLVASNQMPQYDVCKSFKVNAEYMKESDKATSKLKVLLNSLLQLQNFLLKQYPETKNLHIQNNKRKAEKNKDMMEQDEDDSMNEEILSDTENENESQSTLVSAENITDFSEHLCRKKLKLSNYEKILSENHKSYIDYRNSVIQKWNEKTNIATGKLGKKINETTLKQIEFALSDKEKTHKKTQLKRSEYKIIGKIDTVDNNEGRRVQEYDCEIYDDDDFYHQILRDLIEYKSSDITDPIQLSKQWIQLQNMRSKIKRKIDTRATKGRRIRYNVHNKLVNFMAPITINDTWTDHAKDELYNSLFGTIRNSLNRNVDSLQ